MIDMDLTKPNPVHKDKNGKWTCKLIAYWTQTSEENWYISTQSMVRCGNGILKSELRGSEIMQVWMVPKECSGLRSNWDGQYLQVRRPLGGSTVHATAEWQVVLLSACYRSSETASPHWELPSHPTGSRLQCLIHYIMQTGPSPSLQDLICRT